VTTVHRHTGSSRPAFGGTSVVDALLVYAEPLAVGAHAVVVGDAESVVAERLLDLGARSVLVFDADPARAANAARNAPRGVTIRPLVDEFDVRDGAFDLAVVPDMAELNDPRAAIARLRRAVAKGGATIALGRAKLPAEGGPTAGAAMAGGLAEGGPTAGVAMAGAESEPFPAALGPATLEYAELYDLFATQFDEVSLVGVVPFQGVVFAELGVEDEAQSVSVDTRLAPPPAPSVFVIVGGERADRARPALDPYAIVQVEEALAVAFAAGAAPELESDLAAAQLKSDLVSAQLEEARGRLVAADTRTAEVATRLDRAIAERDGALTRGMELEAVLSAAQQTIGALERRLLETERAVIDRDDRLAMLSAEVDLRRGAESADPEMIARLERAESALANALAELAVHEENTTTRVDIAVPEIAEIATRAQRAETALALSMNDLAQMAEAHSVETAAYEAQLRERARLISGLEKEVIRREHLVKELVASLEEAREAGTNGVVFQTAEPLSVNPQRASLERAGLDRQDAEIRQLRGKLDEMAAEVARREGELVARAWRITELENEREQSRSEASAQAEQADGGDLGRLQAELDALRQALAQEHEARVAAESGEELRHARSELARQAALLEQIRGRPS
jgi:hypothetical protein